MTSPMQIRQICGKNQAMHWVYLSPHLDDIAYSCGGLVWEQSRSGEKVSIWTICAGDAPSGELSPFALEHHERWQTGIEAVAHRRLEDAQACELLGASFLHLTLPDAIYRRAGENYFQEERILTPTRGTAKKDGVEKTWLYTFMDELFGEINPAEAVLIDQLSQVLAGMLEKECELVCPLGLGDHVDHKLTRAAAERLGKPLWYYADFPYALQHPLEEQPLIQGGWEKQVFHVSPEGLEMWYRAIAAHQSQISTFWSDLSAMRAELERHFSDMGGVCLWRAG